MTLIFQLKQALSTKRKEELHEFILMDIIRPPTGQSNWLMKEGHPVAATTVPLSKVFLLLSHLDSSSPNWASLGCF